MILLRLDSISLAYGHYPLLDNADLQIQKGERICLVGRNGTGKSTLFRVITGETAVDDGERWQLDTLRIACLAQEVPGGDERSIFNIVADGLGKPGQLLNEYHDAVHAVQQNRPHALEKLHQLQQQIESGHGWDINQKVDTVLSKLALPGDKSMQSCSGGIRRRVMLARSLVSDPDLLLLDEPTNHMDIAAITWLEEFLLNFKGALVFITHDRKLVKNLATRIIELDRGRLTSFPGNFSEYLRRKEEILLAEEKANARHDRKLADHEAWIRQGIKARRTRNEGRVRKLMEMRREKSRRLAQKGKVNMDLDAGMLSGKLVVDMRHVSFAYGQDKVIDDFSTRILRGDRIGIMGANGCGKSTLLKLLLGELQPQSGQIIAGTKLQTAWFDQQRSQLDLEKSVRDNISPGSDFINIRGRSRHVISYLKDFLFPPERMDSPVKSLSGGERNRLLLAGIFTRPANMLILDEPTNDLDVDTLELLEDLLGDYEGTLLLVSHDRTFLDNIVTSTIVFNADGTIEENAGGYEDREKTLLYKRAGAAAQVDKTGKRPGAPKPKRYKQAANHKPGFREKRELEAMPGKIEALELAQQDLQQQVSRESFYRQDKQTITATLARMQQLTDELDNAYKRWEYLEAFKK